MVGSRQVPLTWHSGLTQDAAPRNRCVGTDEYTVNIPRVPERGANVGPAQLRRYISVRVQTRLPESANVKIALF